MREIYEEASRVLVWLDNGDSNEVKTFSKLRSYAIRGRLLASQDEVVAPCQPRNDSSNDQVLVVFFRNPWFTSRWVLQEITAHEDTTIYYSLVRISWSKLLTASLFLEPATNIPDVRHVLEKINSLRATNDYILGLLWTFHDAACSGNRDRINALLGLVPNCSWQPDYSRSWMSEYERLARAALNDGDFDSIGRYLAAFSQLCEESPSCPT